MNQVVILAGGMGSRLRERLNGLPKPLIDICGKPLLERQIELVKRYGFTHILLLVNYGSQQIISFCRSRNNWGIDIECIDDGQPLGTAGATLAIYERLEDEFLVMYGDTMLEVDLARFYAFHSSHPNADGTLFLHPNDHPHDSDLVDMDSQFRILAFYPYPHEVGRYYPNLVNAALYLLRRKALLSWLDKPGLLDFGKDIFPEMLTKGFTLLGYNSPEYIKDCGTPKRLDNVCDDFSSGRISNSCLNAKHPAVFLDRDGTINPEVGHLSKLEHFKLFPGVGEAIKRLNHSKYRSIVITNQPVVARGDLSLDGLQIIHNKLETLLGMSSAYLDRIYYCPHHPHRGYQGEVANLKVSCNCRKPNTGMIDFASADFNIDLSQSWLIGDTTVDILTARRAKIRSVLVETGFAGSDFRYHISPDFVFPNLQSAVNFILDDYPRLIDICLSASAQVESGDFVFIGGLPYSGKSNFATCLKEALKAKGLTSSVLSIDRRTDLGNPSAMGPFDRCCIDRLRSLISDYSHRPETIDLDLPAFPKLDHLQVSPSDPNLVFKNDVLIVEGSIALLMTDLAPKENSHAWYVKTNQATRHQRIIAGCKTSVQQAIYEKFICSDCQSDNTQAILDTAAFATHCFDLSDNI